MPAPILPTGCAVTATIPASGNLLLHLRLAVAVLLGAALLATAGCARTQIDPRRTVRVAVLDGIVEYDVPPGGEVRREGWWFGSRDRFISPNIAIQIGDQLAHELDRVPGVDVYSREDLTIYMARKERLLRRSFPELGDSYLRKQFLLRQDPLDYGRSLNVDYVVTSTVERASTVTNRTFSWWYSHLDATVEIWDVARGEIVYTVPYDGTAAFWSQLRLAERLARRTANNVKRHDLFRLQAL